MAVARLLLRLLQGDVEKTMGTSPWKSAFLGLSMHPPQYEQARVVMYTILDVVYHQPTALGCLQSGSPSASSLARQVE